MLLPVRVCESEGDGGNMNVDFILHTREFVFHLQYSGLLYYGRVPSKEEGKGGERVRGEGLKKWDWFNI